MNKAAEQYADKFWKNYKGCAIASFKAGAKWQLEEAAIQFGEWLLADTNQFIKMYGQDLYVKDGGGIGYTIKDLYKKYLKESNGK